MCCQGPQFCHHDYYHRVTEKHKLQGSLFTCQNVSEWWCFTNHSQRSTWLFISRTAWKWASKGEKMLLSIQGKSPSYFLLISQILFISWIVTCLCSINSVLGEDWDVCACSPKCSYPVGIIPSQERQSFTMGCEAAGELILWWSNCNDQIPWYCLVRWSVMFGRFFFFF